MMTCDRTIALLAQRRRVLGLRADIRLARAIRDSLPLHTRLWRQVLRRTPARPREIRHWENGKFVVRSTREFPRTPRPARPARAA